jgi:hypothetical protein
VVNYLAICGKLSCHFWQIILPFLANYLAICGKLSCHFWQIILPFMVNYQIEGCTLAAWHKGHRIGQKKRKIWVRIPPGCEFFLRRNIAVLLCIKTCL